MPLQRAGHLKNEEHEQTIQYIMLTSTFLTITDKLSSIEIEWKDIFKKLSSYIIIIVKSFMNEQTIWFIVFHKLQSTQATILLVYAQLLSGRA